MAITITVTPDDISASYRRVLWTATSNSSTIVRMIADVKIDGTIRASIDKDPNIGTADEFDFDVQSVIQDYLTENLETITTNDIVSATNSEVLVQLEFYEVTDSSGTMITAWEEDGSGTPDLSSSSMVAINATLQHTDTQDLDIYTIDDTTKLFLTNAPLIQKVQRTETIQLHFLTNEAEVKVILEEYNSSDVSAGDVLFPSSAHVVSRKSGIITVDISTMLSTTSYFTIKLCNVAGTTFFSVTMRFNIDDVCFDDQVRLKWVNPLGGIDAYTFKGQHKEELRFSTKTFQKALSKSFTQQDRGETTLRTDGVDYVDVFSVAEPRATIQWLSEIGLSSDVWIEDNGYIPVTVNTRKVKTLNALSPEKQAMFRLRHSNERITQKN